jgi:phosphoserine phosphatase RsbU/P
MAPRSTKTRAAVGHTAELEVRTRKGKVVRTQLRGDRFIIGRLPRPQTQIRLNHETVSRQHAELYRDPFGRWWIRDLGSRFGTQVNGSNATEHVLTGDDDIRIGEYHLRITPALPEPDPVAARELPAAQISDELAGQISTLEVTAETRISATHLAELLALGRELGDTPDIGLRMRDLCARFAIKVMGGRHALVLRLWPGRPGEPPRELAAARAEDALHETWPYVSRTVVRKICETRQPLLASNTPLAAPHAEVSRASEREEIAILACPLREAGDALDVLYIMVPRERATLEWLALAALAAEQYRHAQTVWQARQRAREHALIEGELRRAREIQNRLLPQTRTFPGLDVAIRFRPCRWVGGDYVDALALPDGRILLVVADVSGKGLAAALTMATVHAVVHAGAGGGFQLAELMARLNGYLGAHLPTGHFVTMFCAVLDCRTGQLEFVDAGHGQAVIVSGDGSVHELVSPGYAPLGVEAASFVPAGACLAPGQWLALFTDGVTDLRDEGDRMLGDAGAWAMLRSVTGELPHGTAEQIAEAFDRALAGHAGQALAADDRTILFARLQVQEVAATPRNA